MHSVILHSLLHCWRGFAIPVLLIALCLLSTLRVEAQRYTILSMNTPTVKIGGSNKMVGQTFELKSCDAIKWTSGKQWIKVRDEATKRTRVLTKRTVCSDGNPRPLKDYLVKTKRLATRSYTTADLQQVDSLVQLLDTVAFRLDNPSNQHFLYRAVCTDGNFKEHTTLPLSPDGTLLYLTRAVFGHHDVPYDSYIRILRYDTELNTAADSLGYLLVQPLPLEIK